MAGIAFFDFDGTITSKDTLLELIKFSKGRLNFFLGFFISAPYLIAYKLKIISNQAAKEKVLAFFFRDMPIARFQSYCDDFSRQRIPALTRPKAMDAIREHQREGRTVVIVTASPENWLAVWAATVGVKLIGSQMEVKAGLLTGKLQGKNCHSDEKVRLIRERFRLEDYNEIYAYGDTPGDKPMLKLAAHSYYKPFR